MNDNSPYLNDFHLASCSDEQLIELSRQQLPAMAAAFTTLMRRYQSQIQRFCLRYLRQEDDAWEVCQDVFIRVFCHLSRFEGRASFRTWLYRIAHNQCNSLARKRRRYSNHLDIDELADLLPAEQDSSLTDGDNDSVELVAKALSELSTTDRDVLRLRYFQDQSLEQLAASQGIGLSAAKMRLYRAQERFNIIYQTGGH